MTDSPEQKDFAQRLQSARQVRNDLEAELRECYKFMFNGRERDFTLRRSSNKPEDTGDLFTELPGELTVDFATDLCDFYAPDTAPWVEYEFDERPEWPDEVIAWVRETVEGREQDILAKIRGSNFYQQCHSSAKEAGHGTMAMWVEQSVLGEPVYCEPVPATQLFVNLGMRGVEDRFRVRTIMAREIPALFGPGPYEDRLQRKIDRGNAPVELAWGFWIDRSDPAQPTWIEHVSVDNIEIRHQQLGAWRGACPLICGRVNPEPNSPWGRGPMRVGLPAARTLDELECIIFEKMDQIVNPSWVYPHDGMLDLSHGIRGGTAYPAAPGSAAEIRELSSEGKIDAGFFEKAQIEDRLRQVFFQDGPRQRADTPPTATQWLDELRQSQRRIGRPTASLWSEFFQHIVFRFEWLMAEAGEIDQVISVMDRVVRLTPISPLVKAQRQDEAMVGRSLLDTAAQVFGEQTPVLIDGHATFNNLKDRMGDTVLVMRDPAEVQQLMQQAQGGGGAAGA